MIQATGVRAHLYGLPLDVRLGMRLLVKHKWLTIVGTVAIAFAIGIGVNAFEFFTQMVRPKLPLEAGDRIVGIVMSDVARTRDTRPTLHDLAAWRDGLKSVQDLAAFRTLDLNLVVGNGAAEPVKVAEIGAAAFRVARAQPLLGRSLVAADEQPGAPLVVVIGYDVWQTRFGSDPGVLGSDVRLGNVRHTIVGVMPSGFGFPLAHSYWVPFRLDPLNYERRRSPAVQIVGRLAPGATLETARSELGVLGAIAAAEFPDTHKWLKPRVVPYIESVSSKFSTPLTLQLTSINLLVVSLVCLICGNVALLMFARAATRENEIVVRTALGASRGRITAQFFAEALVLAAVAAVVGLTAARLVWGWVFDVIATAMFGAGAIPFWLHRSLSRSTVIYAVVLTLVAAGIMGYLPGRKVTRGLATRLRQAGTGGGGLQFGRTWTVLIVMQVAFMAIVPVFLFIARTEAHKTGTMDIGVPTEEYLSAVLAIDGTLAQRASRDTLVARVAAAWQELERRLEAEPGVKAVTYAERLPLMEHPTLRIEVDEGGAAKIDERYGGRYASSARVALDFFAAFGAPILSGRDFHTGDLQPGARAVIVNQSFVQRVLGGRNPIGRHLRYSYAEEVGGPKPSDEPWYEIVGVVRDMGMGWPWNPNSAGVYHPSTPGMRFPLAIAIRTSGDPLLLAPRMRAIASQVEPAIQLHKVTRLDQATASGLRIYALVFWMSTAVTGVSLLLSLVGIHAVFSFITTQRTREMGIRIALGGRPRHVAAVVFRRPAIQIGLGVAIGLWIALSLGSGNDVPLRLAAFVATYGCAIGALAALAIAAPVRRALRISPAEALRAE